MPIIPDPSGVETEGSLGFAGFQPNWENMSPRSRERSLHEKEEVESAEEEDTWCSLLVSVCMPGVSHMQVRAQTQVQKHTYKHK